GREGIFLGADGVGDALGFEKDLIPFEANREPGRDRRELRFVARVDSLARAGERDQPVQGAAVETMESQGSGDFLRDGALARGRRAPSRGKSPEDRKSTRLNSSHVGISYAVFCVHK